MKEAAINPLPPVVWALALPMIAMEVVLALGASGLLSNPMAEGWRLAALERFGFFPGILRAMVETGDWPLRHAIRILTYPFVHVSVTQAVFDTVILLALGKVVAEAFRPWALLAVFFGAAIAGAAAQMLIPGMEVPLVGGFPAIHGLVGAFTFILWMRMADRRAFSLIAMLLGVQLVFGLAFGGAWALVANLAGFVAGFALSFVVSPGGWARVMARIRQR